MVSQKQLLARIEDQLPINAEPDKDPRQVPMHCPQMHQCLGPA